MPAVGRDRRPDLPFLDSGGALVGLGVLRHFRITVDSKRALLGVAPGPSYVVLTRLGFEIDERDGAPTVTRIVYGEHDWNKPLRVGDVVLAVDGRNVKNRAEALARIAAAKREVRVTIDRHGNVVSKTLVM
jgi:S1-C subfamily serine protease